MGDNPYPLFCFSLPPESSIAEFNIASNLITNSSCSHISLPPRLRVAWKGRGLAKLKELDSDEAHNFLNPIQKLILLLLHFSHCSSFVENFLKVKISFKDLSPPCGSFSAHHGNRSPI